MMIKHDKPTIELKPASYQPSKAELNAPIDLTNPDGSKPSPEELATWLLQPVRTVGK